MIRRSKPLRRTPLPRSTSEIKRTTYRQLGAGETPPAGEPRRYSDPRGYVRLRWKVGPWEYVETYERDVAGALVRTQPSAAKRIDVAAAWRLYVSGMTLPEVGAALDCDHGALSRALRRAGYELRPANSYRHRPPDAGEVVRLYEDGLGLRDTARSVGSSVGTVRAVLRSQGVSVRYRRMTDRVRSEYEAEFARMRPLVRAASRGRCGAGVAADCSGIATHVHHRKLRSQGGPNTLDNLLDVCLWCHATIHGNPARSYAAGLLVRGSDDPAAVPVNTAAWMRTPEQ